MFHPESLLMKFLNWLSEMMELQFWWLLGILRGGIIFGLFPATFAMFGVSRALIRGGNTFSLKRKFFDFYKQEFKKANLIGFFWIFIESLLIMNFRSSTYLKGNVETIFFWLSYGILIFWSIAGLYLIPVYSHFKITLKELPRYVVTIIFSSPIQTVLMFGVLFLFNWGIKQSLILLFVIAFGILTDLIMRISNQTFNRIQKKSK